jgi:hypothetical protein
MYAFLGVYMYSDVNYCSCDDYICVFISMFLALYMYDACDRVLKIMHV